MLGRLLLILVQLVLGWYAALELGKFLPHVGNLNIFLMAGIFTIVVWAIGMLAAAVLKDLSQPSSSTLLFAFAVAVLFAVVAVFPETHRAVQSVVGDVDARLYPLVGAVVGYAIQN
jgi:hypothetical protein